MCKATKSEIVERYDFSCLCENKHWLPVADVLAGKITLIIERYENDTIFFHQITTTPESGVAVRTFSNYGSETTDMLHNDEQVRGRFRPDMDWIEDITIYLAKPTLPR